MKKSVYLGRRTVKKTYQTEGLFCPYNECYHVLHESSDSHLLLEGPAARNYSTIWKEK